MSEQFLGEIRVFGFGFAPKGWAQCNGQTMAIQQNQALFSLLGTAFGGNGMQNFQLPNLQGRTPISMASPSLIGTAAGTENITPNASQLPAHGHTFLASSATANLNTPGPANALASGGTCYAPAVGLLPMNAGALGGGSAQPHNNVQPTLVLNFCIALTGIYPSRN